MARIRTVKPEFFTSEDIVALSPLARLFFQACWCEADREGRMEWKPRTMKLRYFPADECDIEAIANEVTSRGLVVPYAVDGKQYADIPSFTKHQNVNPRETQSKIPARGDADACRRVPTRADASNLDVHAQRGREGKGKEGKEPPTPLSAEPDEDGLDWFGQLGSADRLLVIVWKQTGASDDDCRKWLVSTKGAGRDKVAAWLKLGPSADEIAAKITATFDEAEHRGAPIGQAWSYLGKVIPSWAAEQKSQQRTAASTGGGDDWHARLDGFKRRGAWFVNLWGPKPGDAGCKAPAAVMVEHGYGVAA
jgi:hypothetical protein